MKKTLKTIAIITFVVSCAEWAVAQNAKIDSLNILINNSTTDTARIRLVSKKLEYLSTINLDSAINLGLETLKEAQEIGFYRGEVDLRQRLVYNYSYKGNFDAATEQLNYLEQFIKPNGDSTDYANVYGNWGLVYGMQSKYDSSIYFFEKKIGIYERNGNSDLLGKSYSNIAIGYQQKSNFPMAMYYQQKSLELHEKNKNESSQAYTYVNMANTYINMGDMERAESAFLKSIELARKMQLKNVELYAYANLSSLYLSEEQWQKSYDIAMKAAQLGSSTGDQGIQAASLAKASRALVNLGQIKKAKETSQKAIAVADSSGQPFNISQAYSNMGYVLISEEKWAAAIPYYEKAFESLEDADMYTEQFGMLYKELSLCYENTGGSSEALKHYKQYAMITDSIRSRENIQKATELTMNYEFEKKEQSAKEKQAAKDEIAHTRQLALIIGLVLSFIIIIGALFAFYQKQKAHALLRQQKKEIETTLTKLKNAQSQLIQSEKMASLGELTAGIAHEIQNPLNFVNNFSEVSNELIDEMNEEIEKGNFDEVKAIATDVRQNLEKINHHGKRADAIVKGMLQHSRSSSGEKKPVNINNLADEYLRLAYHGLRAKDKTFNATLVTDYDKTIGKIDIIPQDVGRVLLNLVNNAFYAVTDKKESDIENYEPTVSMTTKKEGDNVVIKVKDNGNGIPQEVLDKIFQPFFTTKPAGQGTGLGLSLSYDIIKSHDGELKVETIAGEGSIFTIIIPETI